MESMDRIKAAAEFLKGKLAGREPETGIILGSGLGNLADQISDQIVIPYVQVPGFPAATAIGHKGNFISGVLGGKQVLAMQGRYHFYEGYGMDVVVMPVRVMAALGVRYLFVSNAVGTMNPAYSIGDLVLIRDHINMIPNSLIGPNLAELGPRFPDMTCAYDLELIDRAEKIAVEMGVRYHKGVYFGNPGPTYETPAEVRFYRMAGGDVLGMSTIPEVIVARHCGLRVFGMSVITNKCNTDNVPSNFNDGDDVVRAADAAADRMCAVFTRLIETL